MSVQEHFDIYRADGVTDVRDQSGHYALTPPWRHARARCVVWKHRLLSYMRSEGDTSSSKEGRHAYFTESCRPQPPALAAPGS